jgi:hypothetical protein
VREQEVKASASRRSREVKEVKEVKEEKEIKEKVPPLDPRPLL